MMSFKDKLKTMMGIDDDEYEMDEFEEEFEEPEEVAKPTPVSTPTKPDLTVVSNPVNQTINKGKSTVTPMNTEVKKLKFDSNLKITNIESASKGYRFWPEKKVYVYFSNGRV
jgi:cell division inhibitor SepF